MLATEPWRVIADPADPEVYAVAGVYKVAGNLPIEDANLIAAAPDMEAALTMLLRDVQDYPAWQRPCAAVDRAKAALAKARGERT